MIEYLRPSAAHTWIVCHGYLALRMAYPEAPDEADNEVREDGLACHWLASEVWHKRLPALNSLSPNQRVLDEPMFDTVDEYLDVLRGWGDNAEVYVERGIRCDYIYPGMIGTPDAWSYDPVTNTLYIADLKYGFRFVEVWFNWQLICYIACLIELLQLNDQTLTVVATIVQPRCSHRDGPVRTWKFIAHDIRGEVNLLKHAAHLAMQPNAMCTPNPGCGDCPGRHACVALQNSTLTALEICYAGIPLELSPVAVGDELRRLKDGLKKMEARITGLEGQAESLLRNGQIVPHWTLATTFSRERWRDGMESHVLRLGKLYNVELGKPVSPITPTQARKLLPADMVSLYAHKPSTGVRLTKQDPLEAIKKFTQ